MNLIISAVKRPSILLPCLLLGLFSALASGCDSTKPSAISGPTPREAALTKTVEELRGELAAAELAAEQAKARTAVALAELKNAPAPQAKAAPVATVAPATNPQSTDTGYVVVNKTLNPGQLIPAATGANPNATERRPAEYWITFKGVQSGKEYPAQQVKEAAYSGFREGVAYTQLDIDRAKIAVPANDAASAPPQR